ncbi:MAG: Uma2 family endonuclease [Candidatus Xenobia bacterium]
MALAHADPLRWTIEQYERLHAMGMLPQNTRMELMDGEIITMPPMQTPHGNSLTRGTSLLHKLFSATHWIRVQAPFNVPDYWQPEPDFLLISMSTYDPRSGHPAHADLIVEVSDSSLAYDRAQKASAYAMAGVADYWIVNVVNPSLEIRRKPVRNSDAAYGHSYGETFTLSVEETAFPLFSPLTAVPVSAWF